MDYRILPEIIVVVDVEISKIILPEKIFSSVSTRRLFPKRLGLARKNILSIDFEAMSAWIRSVLSI